MGAAPLSTRVRESLRDLLYHQRVTNRDATVRATNLSGEPWNEHRLGRILAGKVAFLLDDADVLARVANTTLTELVRDPGREYVADLTPGEMQLLQTVRSAPHVLGPILSLLRQLTPEPPPEKPTREQIRKKIRAW